ncbi:MAG TPA: hypothetical protein PKA99_13675 [Dermatophilaceae bacterium]|mgnify:CR=1 FL=1|nr:hypothetical protein [Dermatophilaceae bacterium]
MSKGYTTLSASDPEEWEIALLADPGQTPILGSVEARNTFRAVWDHGMCPETDGPHYLDLSESWRFCYACGADLESTDQGGE